MENEQSMVITIEELKVLISDMPDGACVRLLLGEEDDADDKEK
ncbi:MAG: hypothetical protein ACI4A3_06960 [Lachnospiraceae bacterium]